MSFSSVSVIDNAPQLRRASLQVLLGNYARPRSVNLRKAARWTSKCNVIPQGIAVAEGGGGDCFLSSCRIEALTHIGCSH